MAADCRSDFRNPFYFGIPVYCDGRNGCASFLHLFDPILGLPGLLLYFSWMVLGFFIFWQWKAEWRSAEQSLRKNPFYGKEVVWRFDSDGYELSQEDREEQSEKIGLEEIKRVEKSSAGILIWLKAKQTYWIPAEAFALQEEFRGLAMELKGNYAAISATSLRQREPLDPY